MKSYLLGAVLHTYAGEAYTLSRMMLQRIKSLLLRKPRVRFRIGSTETPIHLCGAFFCGKKGRFFGFGEFTYGRAATTDRDNEKRD
jgi:hypothetical protein